MGDTIFPFGSVIVVASRESERFVNENFSGMDIKTVLDESILRESKSVGDYYETRYDNRINFPIDFYLFGEAEIDRLGDGVLKFIDLSSNGVCIISEHFQPSAIPLDSLE